MTLRPASLLMMFGPFRLRPTQRELSEGDETCRLGSRAMDILIALAERAGETVSKQTLLARAWPDTCVDDANLRVHVAALRKALGDGQHGRRFIVNEAGRGYRFVAPVTSAADHEFASPSRSDPGPSHNLPAQLVRLVGRERVVAAVAAQVAARRFVTVVGPGGVGKTTVALAVAERLLRDCGDGAWFVDLTKTTDPEAIPYVIASVLGFSPPVLSPVTGLVAFLRSRHMLLVLDNCEHVIAAAATIAEQVRQGAPCVHLLATSREALGATGEWVHRLAPMETPDGVPATAAEALTSPAVELLVERAKASIAGFELQDADAPIAADICRRLDGLPLAIELVAARIDTFGLRGLMSLASDRALLSAKGRRTAQERHQTLLAMIDWSYQLLNSTEQEMFRRLSAIRGDFTIESAADFSSTSGFTVEQVVEAIATLSAKFMVATDVAGGTAWHRLSHVSRSFASQLLQHHGEAARVKREHAEWCLRLLARAWADWEHLDRAEWLSDYGRSIDDIRAALDWAQSDHGDLSLGLALTAAALPLGFQLSLVDEFRARVERVLLSAGQVSPPQALAEMRLNTALGAVSQNVATPVHGRTAGFYRAIDLAQQLDKLSYQAEPLIGMAGVQLGAGEYGLAVEMAEQAAGIAASSGDELAIMATGRVLAQARHFIGDHGRAYELARAVLAGPARRIPLAYNLVPVDHRVSMRIILARVLWIQGCAEQAAAMAEEAVQHAAGDSPFSMCQALTLAAVPIALWAGDQTAAAGFVQRLEEQASRYTLPHWQSWAAAFQVLLQARTRGGALAPYLSGALQHDTFATFSAELVGLATIQRAQAGNAGWCAPEIIRVQGEWMLKQGSRGAVEGAEALFRQSLSLAQRQGALAWELRTAISQARLWQRQNHHAKADALLNQVLSRFPQSSSTADLRGATALLRAVPVHVATAASSSYPTAVK